MPAIIHETDQFKLYYDPRDCHEPPCVKVRDNQRGSATFSIGPQPIPMTGGVSIAAAKAAIVFMKAQWEYLAYNWAVLHKDTPLPLIRFDHDGRPVNIFEYDKDFADAQPPLQQDEMHTNPDLAVGACYMPSTGYYTVTLGNGKRSPVDVKGILRTYMGQAREIADDPDFLPLGMVTSSGMMVWPDGTLAEIIHGAGRRMSRGDAKNTIDRAAAKARMKNIAHNHENLTHIIDETGEAYKDIEQVIDSVVGAGIAKMVARVLPIAVVKG